MSELRYLVVKEKNKKEVMYFEYDHLSGLNMSTKSKNIKLKDAININKMIIINPSFVRKVIDKKFNLKIKKLIDLIALIYNSDDNDDNPAGNLMQALNEIEKFKRQLFNRYLQYMSKEQINLYEKKIKILETEVMNYTYKINERNIGYYKSNEYKVEDVYEPKKSR